VRRWPSFKTIQNYVRWSKCLNELVARCETLCLTMANRQLADTVRDKSHPFMFQYIIDQRMIYNKKNVIRCPGAWPNSRFNFIHLSHICQFSWYNCKKANASEIEIIKICHFFLFRRRMAQLHQRVPDKKSMINDFHNMLFEQLNY